MAVRIITDSACDIHFSMSQQLNIDIMPIVVSFGENEYLDGRDMNADKFYEMLAQAPELPKTAQLIPSQFEDIFRPYVEAGDSIIVMPLSRELSGTYNNACIAAQQFPDAEIYVIDTLAVTFQLGLMVHIAIDMRDSGMGAADIASKLEEMKSRIRLYAVIGDLKYLRLGGRLSSTGAVLGTLLGIKPIISIEEGKVINIDKARGLRAGFTTVIDNVEKMGIDRNYPLSFGHSSFPEGMEELFDMTGARLDWDRSLRSDIGPIVGTHSGPGAAGIAFVSVK